MPKVSVIIPVYGVEKYIERCARSLFEQTLYDIEYLFIDDCTPDRSIEILKSVLEEYPNRKSQVIIHRMEQNSGQAAVRRWGMLNATGDYVIHCDSDDWVDTDMYRAMYDKALGDGADIVICDYCQTDGGTQQMNIRSFENGLDKMHILKAFFLEKYSWAVWNKLVSRKLYTTNRIIFPSRNMGEDMVLTIQFLKFSKKIAYINRPMYFYFKNEISITGNCSLENVLVRTMQLKENVDLVLNLYMYEEEHAIIFKNELDYLKVHVKCELCQYSQDNKLLNIWRNVYPELKFIDVLHLKGINCKLKIIYAITSLGLYPLFKRLF